MSKNQEHISSCKKQLEDVDEPPLLMDTQDKNHDFTTLFMYVNNNQRCKVAQHVLDTIDTTDNNPRLSLLFAYATLLITTTKTKKSETEQVVFLLNKAEYKLRNALTCCEITKEYTTDISLRIDLHLLLSRVLFELSISRLEEQSLSNQLITTTSTTPISISSSNGRSNTILPSNSNNSNSPSIGTTNISPTHGLSGDNSPSNQDSPIRKQSSFQNNIPNNNSPNFLKSSSDLNKEQQQIDQMFQEICIQMDTSLKLFGKQKQQDEYKKALMYFYFGDILTNWSARRKQRWAALCSQALERFSTSIQILEKLITESSTNNQMTSVNCKLDSQEETTTKTTNQKFVYCSLHHHCLYKYASLLLYWARRKREYSTIYTLEKDKVNTKLEDDGFNFDSVLNITKFTGLGKLGQLVLKESSRYHQSIYKNSQASNHEKLCKACVVIWEAVCNIDLRKTQIFTPKHSVNPRFLFRLSNSLYEYALLLVPSASILSINDYLTTHEEDRSNSRSEVLSSTLGLQDLLFKERMLNDKKEILINNNRKVLSEHKTKTVILEDNKTDDLKIRFSLIFSNNTDEINITIILTRQILLEKALEVMEKANSASNFGNFDFLLFTSQIYFELGALKTMQIATLKDSSSIVNLFKQHQQKLQQKEGSSDGNEDFSQKESIKETAIKELDNTFTHAIECINRVLEKDPNHVVTLALLGEIYFTWARGATGIDSDKNFQKAVDIWTRIVLFCEFNPQINIGYVAKMIDFTMEIRKSNIICDGMALKQGKLRKNWTERYWMLTLDYFGYYQIKNSKSMKKKLKNSVLTSSLVKVQQNTDEQYTKNKNYPFCLEIICKKRTFYVCLSSQEELDKWVSAFNYVIEVSIIISGTTSLINNNSNKE
ncbi:hypothetical protein ABK040_011673 [Willaertia magna]